VSPRVLHLIPTLQGGGAEHQLAILAEHLPKLGWDMDIAYIHPGIHLERIARSSASLHRLQVRGNYDPLLMVRIVALLRRLRPDLVQTWLPQMDVVGGTAARVMRVPWIISQRSTRPLEGRQIIRFLRRYAIRGATAVITNSHLSPQDSSQAGLPHYYIPNAVQLDAIASAGPSARVHDLRRRGAKQIAIAVGRLIGLKRFEVFIDAMKRVCAETQSAGLICGVGPLRAELEARVRAAGLEDRVLFAGFLVDVVSDIKAADALVALSEYEGRPNAVIEAMAACTPLVVSDIPEHREILDETRAKVVDGSDANAVAAALREIFADPAAAQARARAARITAQEWDAPCVAGQHAAVYERILTSVRGRA